MSAEAFKDQLKNQLAQACALEFPEECNAQIFRHYFLQCLFVGIRLCFMLLISAETKSIYFQRVRGKCLEKCITKPGSNLTDRKVTSCVGWSRQREKEKLCGNHRQIKDYASKMTSSAETAG
ncbi:hypothetical protein O6P43_008360 [Quillaja saponaria]|uniref:Uncharacterized protein n=1 Tax=Quillaja saponaria TaxID=32244 RepID=A0AAD7M544_QUISA|nr:hypothetical protein O6P43_008360 [Quillaja saponaria]